MKDIKFSAPVLRIMLVVILFLITAASIAGFMYGESQVKKFALEVSKKTIDADASDSKIQNLQKAQRQLDANQDSVKRAQEIVAESASYQYQDQVIKDLRDYASRSGVSIGNLDFTPTAAPGTIGAAGAAGGAPGASSSNPAASAKALTNNGLKSTTVTVTLKNPVDFNSFMKFLHFIEQSLTKMQISKIELAKVNDKSRKSAVNASALTIEVYLK